MCGCHSIPEFCVMFCGVKLSIGLFVLFAYDKVGMTSSFCDNEHHY